MLSLTTITNSLYKIVAPKPPPVDAVIESTSAPATTQTTIKLKFELSWFLNTDNGVRTDGGVMVCQASKCTGYGKMYNFILKLKQQDVFIMVTLKSVYFFFLAEEKPQCFKKSKFETSSIPNIL